MTPARATGRSDARSARSRRAWPGCRSGSTREDADNEDTQVDEGEDGGGTRTGPDANAWGRLALLEDAVADLRAAAATVDTVPRTSVQIRAQRAITARLSRQVDRLRDSSRRCGARE